MAGTDVAMRKVISPTVAVVIPTKGKSLIVCAHASMCVCVRALVIVTDSGAERSKGEIGGGPAGIHVWPGLFKVYVSFFTTLYWGGGGSYNNRVHSSKQ